MKGWVTEKTLKLYGNLYYNKYLVEIIDLLYYTLQWSKWAQLCATKDKKIDDLRRLK